MSDSKTQMVNEAALNAARQRSATEASYIDKINQQLTSRDYADVDRERLSKLRDQLGTARKEIDSEVAARQDLKSAYDESTYANKDADPAVKAASKRLSEVRSANKPVNAKDNQGKNLVNEVCQPCMDKALNTVDCNTPVHLNYRGGGGPAYKRCGHHNLGKYQGWDQLIKSGKKTGSEKNVLSAMSQNEGDFDDVQAYDSEALTVGAMQKTVNASGTGELPEQLARFRDSSTVNKAVFDRELASAGYSVENTGTAAHPQQALFFKDPANVQAQKLTGSALKHFVRDNADRWKDTLGPFRSLGRTPEFQTQQVMDFNARLVGALKQSPTGYNHPIRDYLSSEYGGSLVLDQSVNRPGYVRDDFGDALDDFYKANPAAAKDPSNWSPAQRSLYEADIGNRYAAVRRGTDMVNRGVRLSSSMSHDPGSLAFPPGIF